MENKEQMIKSIELFLEKVVIQELGKLQQIELSYMQFVLMGQAIEVLGSFWDNKPMKAKDQSSKRFNNGVKYLFGGRYRLLNEKNFLYDKLRNQLTHTFIAGNELLLLPHKDTSSQYKHLDYCDGKLILIGDTFYEDICAACSRLLTYLKTGKIKPKHIAFKYDDE